MIDLIKKQNCCGCGACVQICPKHCVELKTDEEGFLYPNVLTDSCVNCGLCRQVCPILENAAQKREPQQVYAARAISDDIRSSSSSGGIFYLLAQSVLNRSGVVFGAAFDADFSVHHIKVETLAQLQHLRGSKYLQSRIEETYIQARDALEQGKTVLFSGVGCQIAGLKTFLRKEYQNLYTVDVLCHGVPSPMVWQMYLRFRENQFESKVDVASFRNKMKSWHHYETKLHFCNGQSYEVSHERDMYSRLFLSEICLRPSCHSCHFREGKSGADITLGDAWGIEKWLPELDDDKGTSLVLVNSEKGRDLWEQICQQTEYRMVDAETALASNMVFKRSVKPHPNRLSFFKAMREGTTMNELLRLTRQPFYRRCISFAKRVAKKLLGR